MAITIIAVIHSKNAKTEIINDDNINKMRFSARSLLNTTDFNNNWQHTLNFTVPSDTGNTLTRSLQITMSWANLAALPTLNNEQFLAPSYSWLYTTNKPKNTTSHHNRSKLTNHHRLTLLESNSQYHYCKNWAIISPQKPHNLYHSTKKKLFFRLRWSLPLRLLKHQ